MEASARQLNPWNNLARVRVANAIVLARAAPPAERPMWYAAITKTPMIAPCTSRVSMKSLLMMDSFGFLGF